MATVADQVGPRATIVAPDFPEEAAGHWPPPPPPTTLFSLVITQRSLSSWYGGVWIALLTGIAILLTALLWLPRMESTRTDAITILVVAPTLVAALLSVRAGSEIAEQLTTRLRRLIGAVGVLAAVCAVGLIAQTPDPNGLEVLWFATAGLLLCIAAALWLGAYRIRCLLAFGRRSAPRVVKDLRTGKVLNPNADCALRIPPPDRWLAADEGELVPWGWLEGPPGKPLGRCPPYPDCCFWQSACHTPLIRWVQEIFHYQR
jgi:hypothetical protein